MKKILSLYGLIGVFFLWGCDTPDDPYQDEITDLGTAAGVVNFGSSFFSSYKSSVLLEDFTGY